MPIITPNTANTISVNFSPGQDIQRPATSSLSLFTFGDYQLQEPSPGFGIINLTGNTFSRRKRDNYQSLTNGSFNYSSIYNANLAKLNFQPEEPTTYAYFSSFYSKIAQSINNISQNFPYAILSNPDSIGNNIVSANYDMFQNLTTFLVDEFSLINQGNVFYKPGNVPYSLFNSYNTGFTLQISGAGVNDVYPINKYFYCGGTNQLFFVATGDIFSGATTINIPLYIRPTLQVMGEFKQTLPQLDYQLLYNGEFLVPNNTDNDSVLSSYTWTRNIDGFNPDIQGIGYTQFVNSILPDAKLVDERKTNIFIRTIIPENLLELDSEDKIFRKLTHVYADEFDEMKRYIDGLAYAHTVEYNNVNSVPNVYLSRLGRLLGIDLKDSFSEVDLFEYIAGDPEGTGSSFQDFNNDLWTRILVNLNFLYKKKGTRDAIMFMFKILGAPDCLINFNEFVYKVFAPNEINNPGGIGSPVSADGYPNINDNPTIFQGNGRGRGNGQLFVDFYNQSFRLQKTADNIKVYTGQTSISSSTESNTRDTINSKEVDIFLDPAQLIECDVKNWYTLGFGYWNWGSTGTCVAPYSAITFSGLTVPFEWSIDAATCAVLNPPNVTGMSISQYTDYLYATFVNPRNRKTYPSYDFTSFVYMNLKSIYINYMLWTNNQESNRLTFQAIDKLLTVIERGFNTFGKQFIPATTIANGPATLYRNTVFERQKYVYKPGINDGSEFKKVLPPEFDPVIITNNTVVLVNDIIKELLPTNNISISCPEPFHPIIQSNNFGVSLPPPIRPSFSTNVINIQVPPIYSLAEPVPREPETTIIAFPIQ